MSLLDYNPFPTFIQIIYKTAECLIKSSKIILKTIHSTVLKQGNRLEEAASHRKKNLM